MERYKCAIIPPPYERKDFKKKYIKPDILQDKAPKKQSKEYIKPEILQDKYPKEQSKELKDLSEKLDKKQKKNLLDLRLSLCLAKTSFLAYKDKKYISDIVLKRWKKEGEKIEDNDFKYLQAVIKRWKNEDNSRIAEAQIEDNKSFKYFDDKQKGTQAFAFQEDNFIVLSFIGTESEEKFRNWRTNLDIDPVKFESDDCDLKEQENDKIKVHDRFQKAWISNRIKQEVLKAINNWKQENLIDEIWVAGHSLGAALATLAATNLREKYKKEKIEFTLCTFGSLCVGNGKFFKHFNNLGIKTYRYVNNNDVVTTIPKNLIFSQLFGKGYKHIGDRSDLNLYVYLKKIILKKMILDTPEENGIDCHYFPEIAGKTRWRTCQALIKLPCIKAAMPLKA
ncbi:MAG: lipase family protein [Prochloraceae cyanobacterium]